MLLALSLLVIVNMVEYKIIPWDVDVILHDVTNNLHCQIEDGVFVRLHRLSCVNNKHQRRVNNLRKYCFGLKLYEYLSGIHLKEIYHSVNHSCECMIATNHVLSFYFKDKSLNKGRCKKNVYLRSWLRSWTTLALASNTSVFTRTVAVIQTITSIR